MSQGCYIVITVCPLSTVHLLTIPLNNIFSKTTNLISSYKNGIFVPKTCIFFLLNYEEIYTTQTIRIENFHNINFYRFLCTDIELIRVVFFHLKILFSHTMHL